MQPQSIKHRPNSKRFSERKTHMKKRVLSVGLVCLLLSTIRVFGFTQGVEHAGSLIPVGHEWITRQAAIELLNAETYLPNDPNDPRLKWPASARATDTSLAGAEAETKRIKDQPIKDLRFASTYKPIYDAILGERWVDIGGVNFVGARLGKTDCLDMVTQEHPDVQYDHFMRKPSDAGAAGGVTTARESASRFVQYFVAAAEATDGNMKVWDGGGYSGEYTVDRHYFLFGRALHLFEDSFSPDHTVRSKDDYFRKVRQVKSYLCGEGSEQHAHLNPPSSAFYQTGDVIWVSMAPARHANDWSRYVPSNIRDYGLASIEGTKEAWAAFIRTMAKPKGAERSRYAQAEAQKLAAKWLGFDEQEMLGWYADADHRGSTYVKSGNGSDDGGQGQTQAQCMTRDWKGATVKAKLAGFEAGRKKCLYNMVPTWRVQTDVDPSLHLPYYWQWRNSTKLIDPPADWKIGDNDTAFQVRFINRENGQPMSVIGNGWAYNGTGEVIEVLAPWPLTDSFKLPVANRPGKHLNRMDDSWGAVGIYESAWKGDFKFELRPDGYYNIKNTYDNVYMYMYTDQRDYINRDGDPAKKNAQWRIEGLPEPYLPDGTYSFSSSDGSEPVTGTSVSNAFPPQLSFGPAGGAVAYAELQRQTDGRYTIKIEGFEGGGYVQVDRGGPRLWFNNNPTYAGTFALQQQQEKGHFKIVSPDGTYWSRKAKAGGPILSSAPADCEDAAEGCQEPLVFKLTWVKG